MTNTTALFSDYERVSWNGIARTIRRNNCGNWVINGKIGEITYIWYSKKEAIAKYRREYREHLKTNKPVERLEIKETLIMNATTGEIVPEFEMRTAFGKKYGYEKYFAGWLPTHEIVPEHMYGITDYDALFAKMELRGEIREKISRDGDQK